MWVGLAPRIMGTGPVIAISNVLARVGLTKGNVDLFEVCMKSNRNGGCDSASIDQ